MALYLAAIFLVIVAAFVEQNAAQTPARGSVGTTPRPGSTAVYVTQAPNDLLDSWAACPECDFCIARNNTAKCFFVIHGVTWPEARTYCANWSGELATIRSDVETRFLNRTKSIIGMGTNAWIGLRWKANANAWLWTDDVPIKSYNEYNLFAPGEPGEGWASCVEFIARDIYSNYLGYYTGYWKVQDCAARRDAICQYQKKLVPM